MKKILILSTFLLVFAFVGVVSAAPDPDDLAGWYIKDQEENVKYITPADTNTGSTIINSGDWLVVYMNEAILNNDADIVYLYDSLNNLIDSYSYDLATYCILEPTPDGTNTEIGSDSCPLEIPGNKSYARIPDGTGTWQDPIPTPGTPNKLSEDGKMELDLLLLEEQIATTTATTILDSDDLENSTSTSTTITNQTTISTTTVDFISDSSTSTETIIETPTEESTTINTEETPAIEEPLVIEESLIIEETPVDGTLVIEQTPAIEEQLVIAPADNNSGEQSLPADNSSSGGDAGGGETVNATPSDGATE